MTKFIIQPHGGLTIGSPTKRAISRKKVSTTSSTWKEAARTPRDLPLSIRRFRSMITVLERSNVMPKDMDAKARAPAMLAVLAIGR